LQRIYDKDECTPRTIEVSSLESIADYWNKIAGVEGVTRENLFLLIESPTRVVLMEKFKGEQKKREGIMAAVLKNDVEPFPFGKFIETEEFIIGLMSRFNAQGDRDTIVSIASGLVAEAKLDNKDSGTTTKRTASAGVVNQSGIGDKNVPVLAPFRTFREVEQPQSAFLFRYRTDGEKIGCALFEADGGAWRHDAMANIASFFAEHASGLPVLR
jgi:hypothetical protein